jgi:hypothetical protein
MYKIAAFQRISDALTGTVGTYNMAKTTFTLTISACTYTLKLDTTQNQISTSEIGSNTSSPGTTPTISSGKTSGARALSPPAVILLAALAGLLCCALLERG